MTKDFHIIIDFDSTFIRVESLEKLAKISLDGRRDRKAILKRMSEITIQGMDGSIQFNASLEKRLKLFSANKSHLDKLVGYLKNNITRSIRENKDFFHYYKNNIYVISGGFIEYIWPVVREYGVKKSHVLANNFVFGDGGEVVDFDRSNPLSLSCGKALKVKSLGLAGDIFVLGDGFTDYEIKKHNPSSRFFVFTANLRREAVVALGDFVVDDFNHFINIFNNGIKHGNITIDRPAL